MTWGEREKGRKSVREREREREGRRVDAWGLCVWKALGVLGSD